MDRVCFYHAGCPDGFGAAWATRRAWGDDARYVPRRHDQRIDAGTLRDCQVVFVDIAPANDELLELARVAEHVVVLDHHVTARDRYYGESAVVNQIEAEGHEIVYDMAHSGAVLAWHYFSPDELPPLLRYVEDQDLWHWQLPDSREVNAALAVYPHDFATWDELASRDISGLVAEGRPIMRANRAEVERRANAAHAIRVEGELCEAVNATAGRSAVGHALAERKAYGVAWGCVYRVDADRIYATLYSIGDVDVASIARHFGGGGHRNAAGFSIPLDRWLAELVLPARA